MKKTFNNPEIRIIKLDCTDIIATSDSFGENPATGRVARSRGRQTWRDLQDDDNL